MTDPRDPKIHGLKFKDDTRLRALIKPHVESFNWFCDHGLKMMTDGNSMYAIGDVKLDAIPEKEFPAISISLRNVTIDMPSRNDDSRDHRMYPAQCRQLATTYEGKLSVDFLYQIGDDSKVVRLTRTLGHVPIMTRTTKCHLGMLTAAQMVERGEEAYEFGGTFIVNGNERIIRLLVNQRRNVVQALVRPSMTNRGRNYTQYATQMRCAREDQTSKTLTLHYLSNGNCNLRFTLRKQEFFIPAYLLLKCFTNATDEQIFTSIVQGGGTSSFDRAEALIAHCHTLKLTTKKAILDHLGGVFRVVMRAQPSMTNEDIAIDLLNRNVFVHCSTGNQKYHCLILMIQKLYALVEGKIKPDNPDANSSHEVLLPGHLMYMIVKEQLSDYLEGVKAIIEKDLRTDPGKVKVNDEAYWRKVLDQQKDVGLAMKYLVTTGNLNSSSGLDLMQVNGFTVSADRLNFFRYFAHFRGVHRGQFFTVMKTTTVRKLLPESWGFMCPVHTPDGAPCGLLNHLTASCEIQTHPCSVNPEKFIQVLYSIGVTPIEPQLLHPPTDLPVLCDGIVIGHISQEHARTFVAQVRNFKVSKYPNVPERVEICAVYDWNDAVFPSINLATAAGRMTRPVNQLRPKGHPHVVEWIGPMEQVFMDIACVDSDFREGETTHIEIDPTSMLSVVASMTPFSDFNQSPRNMYQCQMAKQTMGTPYHSFPYRVDNKTYRIQNPQGPMVKNENYDRFLADEYPLGCNAVVAVISYTGYDMEDAMIINKAAAERGWGHACVNKYKKVSLAEYKEKGGSLHHFFANEYTTRSKQASGQIEPQLDSDGLPHIGTRASLGTPLYCVVDDLAKQGRVTTHKDKEDCTIEEVRALGAQNGPLQELGIKMRFNRNPILGDKFSSRHGQKGVLSQLWPQENMPFTESGLSPDVLINPHAFPSRMTIGMLIESMAGKVAAMQGRYQESTPFRFTEDETAVDYFGKQLVAAGYNYAGTETLYSGFTGTELKVEIFFGLVYYQRLRHMVSDKSQVRSTGTNNAVTRQPMKGRKVGGGIRFGEMERDSLLAHGTSFLLADRLMHCSDYHTAHVCTRCGSLTSPSTTNFVRSDMFGLAGRIECKTCKTGEATALIAVPYVFLYLCNELAAMNIKLTLDVREK